MSDVTRLLFLADNVRDSMDFYKHVFWGNEPTITTRVNRQQREQMIARLCALLRNMCSRSDNTGHMCVTVETIACTKSVRVMIIYGRDCLYSSSDVTLYLQKAHVIVQEARRATVRDAARC